MNTPAPFPQRFRLHALSAAVMLGLVSTAHAQLNLLREPANARVTEPAPNIILSLDDSGSMGWDLEGCPTPDIRVDLYGTNFTEGGRGGCPWYASNPSPSRTRILRDALIDTFGNPNTGSKGIIEDNRIRLAWQTMWDNARTRRPGHLQNWQDRIDLGQPNALKPFSGAHRQDFHDFVRTLSGAYGTPSHKMMANVHNYMASGLSVNSPFALIPGTQAEPYLACRRTYHIFMTDGAWNSETGGIGNVDGSSFSFPDGTVFGASDQTRIYRDGWGGTIGTLADWAMRNWSTDFASTLPNEVKPIIKKPGNEVIGSTTLQEYWNPKNNPMTWQGVTQYTIGFGTSATRWTSQPPWGTDTHTGTGYTNLVNNSVTWGDVFSGGESARPMDLWHMALNGRGKYYQARSATDLRVAFNDILQTILVDTSSPLAAGTGSNIKLGLGGQAFLTAYDGKHWRGRVRALQVSSNGTVQSVAWDGDALLDARNSSTRRLLTHNGSNATTFDWSNLSDEQKNALRGGDSDTLAQERLDYLRGTRAREEPAGPLRQRDSVLGSLVNSVPVLMGPPTVAAVNHPGRAAFIRDQRQRRPVLFVGSNGGMLHGFDAGTGGSAGQELFAYVPRGVYSKLRSYTQPDYQHQFMVDGSPMVGDANLGTDGNPNWRSVLVGTLGLGGRGFFVLDVTDPAALSGTNTPPAAVVLLDRTTPSASGAESHIGHIASAPATDDTDDNRSAQIVKLNNGRWAAVMGNGVNSASGRAALLLQFLDNGRELVAITAGTDTNNGLGTPRLVDLDGNGTADLAYAGDQRGNLWSFNLGGNAESAWSVRFAGQPLFVARNASNTAQPITAAPYVMRVPRSQHLQVAFGTGRLMDTADAANGSTQSLYSVRDPLIVSRSGGTLSISDGERISDGRASLVAQTSGAFSGRFATTSNNSVDYRSRRGWYMDLSQSGERLTANPEVFQGSVLRFRSTIPSTQQGGESCNLGNASGRFFSTFVDIFSGAPAKSSVFGVSDTSTSRIEQDSQIEFTVTKGDGEIVVTCKDLDCGTKDPKTASRYETSKPAPTVSTVDWRRLQ